MWGNALQLSAPPCGRLTFARSGFERRVRAPELPDQSLLAPGVTGQLVSL
jgi:hypothetical protein